MSGTKEKSPEFNNASLYHSYALKYPVYKTAAKRLIGLFKKHYQMEPKTVFDIASGTGITTERLLENFPVADIVSFDKSETMMEFTRQQFPSNDRLKLACSPIEGISPENYAHPEGIFCSAAFWYFDRVKALEKIYSLLSDGGVFVFNISEPAIDLGDGKYDYRFLQKMVEVLDDFGIVFHREDGYGVGKLKLSYKPPLVKDVLNDALECGFTALENDVWEFSKGLEELADFYAMPGFGTKAFRELTDNDLKQKILDEVLKRLRAKRIDRISFRWAEFALKKP